MKSNVISILALFTVLAWLGQLSVPLYMGADDVTAQEIPFEEGDDDNKKEDSKDKILQAMSVEWGESQNSKLIPKIPHLRLFEIPRSVIPPPPKS
jgi:hypothetical protein